MKRVGGWRPGVRREFSPWSLDLWANSPKLEMVVPIEGRLHKPVINGVVISYNPFKRPKINKGVTGMIFHPSCRGYNPVYNW